MSRANSEASVVAAVGIGSLMLGDLVIAIANCGMYNLLLYHPILMTAPPAETMIERPRMIRIGLMMSFCCDWNPFKSDATSDGGSLYIKNLRRVIRERTLHTTLTFTFTPISPPDTRTHERVKESQGPACVVARI
jgi:hypothetical protein